MDLGPIDNNFLYIDVPFHNRQNLQADLDAFGVEQGRGARRFLAVQDEGRNFGGQRPPVVAERANLHAPASAVFHFRDDAQAHFLTEPMALEREKSGRGGGSQQYHDGSDTLSRQSAPPAHSNSPS